MPEKYMFFDSTPDDPREYPASQFAEYFSRLLTNGILNGGTNLQVSAPGNNMSVMIAPGYAWINGYLYAVYGEPISLEIPDADSTFNRIDRIVLRLDTTLANRYIKAFVKQGMPDASPVPPELTRTDNIYEISLAQILVIAGRSYIDGTQITDERLNTTVCGLVNSLIQADTTNIFNQFQAWLNLKTAEFEAAWDAWFDGQKAGSGAYALQADLTALENEVDQIGDGLSSLNSNFNAHKDTLSGENQVGHVKLDSALYTGLEVTEAGILRLKHNPQMISGSAEYTDSFQVVFNETKYIYLATNFLPFRLLTVFIRNMADPQKYLLYQIFPYKGYTRGVVQGRNSSGDHIVLPYPIGGDALGAVSGANSVGYGVAGTNGVSIILRGIRTESPIALEIAFAGSPSASLNCRVEYLLS